MRTFEKIYEMVDESNYKENRYNIKVEPPRSDIWSIDHIVDADKSVNWNREQVALHNQKVREARTTFFEQRSQMTQNFKDDIAEAIKYEYGFSADQTKCIIEHTDCSDFYDAAVRIEDTCELITDFLNCEWPD